MAHLSSLGLVALAALAVGNGLAACTAPAHPDSLVSAGGQASQGGRTGGNAGNTTIGEAGQIGSAGESGEGGEAGAVQIGIPARPLALFASTLDVNAGCGDTQPQTDFLIRNGGSQQLIIESLNADSGYVVTGNLPLTIAPGAGVGLHVAPPAPKAGAQVGDMSTGKLSFKSNELGTSTHEVALRTTLFGARLEFTDHEGAALAPTLTLTYLNESDCPDAVKYRVHNIGNLAFKLLGPTFPAHLAGTTTGPDGLSVAP
ncbi:MAG TPA: hypothetical protein VGL19_10275, partial [Polyangiaceae bacterium]